jgi:hypothetical protein
VVPSTLFKGFWKRAFMNTSGSNVGLVLSLLLAVGSVLFASGVVYLCRFSLRAVFRDLTARFSSNNQARAIEAAAQLKTDLREFQAKIALLEEYAPEYHNSFTSGGWVWLTSTAEHLSAAEHIIDLFLSSGRYQDAYCLSAFLNGNLAHAEMPLAALRFADFVDLLDWKARTKEQLIKLLDLVQEGATLNKEIGLQRTRKRRPTIHTIADLKRGLDR